jgi:hypothetical protein
MSQRNKAFLAAGLLVAALLIGFFAYRQMNASPYPEISKDEQKAAQERINKAYNQGPPGMAPRR